MTETHGAPSSPCGLLSSSLGWIFFGLTFSDGESVLGVEVRRCQGRVRALALGRTTVGRCEAHEFVETLEDFWIHLLATDTGLLLGEVALEKHVHRNACFCGLDLEPSDEGSR